MKPDVPDVPAVPEVSSKPPTVLLAHKIQLRGGRGKLEGNVYVDGKPVCDDDWDIEDARVVCRMMGWSVVKETKGSHFGKVPDNFAMDNVDCVGDELDIEKCVHFIEDNCGKDEGAGVVCKK